MAINLSENPLDSLLVQFTSIYSQVSDTGLDLFLHPTPWFMPLNSYVSKREAAKFFLLAASLSDSELTGNARNIRILLDHLHSALGEKLYTLKNPSEFEYEVKKCSLEIAKLDQLGPKKVEIPEVMASVNRFVDQKAHGDLVDYCSRMVRKGTKPESFVKELSCGVTRMNDHHVAKAWLYLRWMVRKYPDLGIFEFSPRDLTVSLTTPKLRVMAALGIVDNDDLPFDLNARIRPSSWWKSTPEFTEAEKTLTAYARRLFPEDPAKVDFPFFVLGTWLEDSDLTPESLERSLGFFIEKYREMQVPPVRYLTAVPHYVQGVNRYELGAFGVLEKDVYDFLQRKQAKFDYEFLEFHLPEKSGVTGQSLTYKPDFLLPKMTYRGRKVLLEPHGIESNLPEFLTKLSLVRKHYGEYFSLVLIVPDNFVDTVNRLDPNGQSYDLLWKLSSYKVEFEKFHST